MGGRSHSQWVFLNPDQRETTVIQWNKQNPGARAALLSGPPGVGKTTSAHLVAKELGFDVIELNASDKRSMMRVRELLKDSVGSQWECWGVTK